MPRRVILAIALLGLALLAIAVAPWTLSPGGLETAVAQHLRSEYGLAFKVNGRSTIALLPMPRVKFEDVIITSADGAFLARGGTLRGQLELLPLLLGGAELSEVSLAQSRITIAGSPGDLFDRGGLASAMRSRGLSRNSSLPHIRRVRLVGSAIQFGGSSSGLENATFTLDWPAPEALLEAAGSFTWRGEQVELTGASLNAAALLAGKISPFVAAVATPNARVRVTGEIQPGSEPRLTGHSSLESRSVRDLSRWSGLEFPLGTLLQAVSIEGDFTAHWRRVSWPSVIVFLGSDRLEGTLGVRFDGERPVVTGTLAAEQINLSDFAAPFAQARTASGLWSGEDLSLLPATGGDLDLRISATSATIGRLKLADVAANVLVRPGRIEAALGRAGINRGTIKGRLALAALPRGGMDFKIQGTFDGVDLGSFLADVREPRWISGQAQGQFALESTGTTPVDIVRQSHGRSTIVVKQGELFGVGLNDTLRKIEKRPLSAFLDWKGGRTPFDQAHVHLNIVGGLGEIVDGAVTAPGLRTALQGHVSLVDRAVAMKAQVDAAPPSSSPGPMLVFDISGGWDDIAIIPDARSLIERSGAAKPLFGQERGLVPGTRSGAAAPVAQ